MSGGSRDLASRLRSSVLARNTAALYGVHAANLLLPLVMIPFLARVLRPEGWGLVVFAQSFAAWLGLLVEYGFQLSATRMVATSRAEPERLRRVVAGVQGAKLLLVLILTIGALLAYLFIPTFQQYPIYLFWAWVLAIAQGATPFWYFQGVERMGAVARLELSARAAATIAVLLVVRSPADGWMVLCFNAAAGLLWVTIGTRWIYREVPFERPSFGASLRALREGVAIFAFRTASGLYMQASAFILGLLSSAATVAYFAGAERVIRAAIGIIQPVSHAVYPRLTHLVRQDRAAAGRLLRLSTVLISGMGLAVGIVALIAAPLLVQLLLGPGYEAAVPVLRALSLLPPIVAIATALGIQWALPMGFDRQMLAFVCVAGVVNVTGALILVPLFGAVGMAAAVLLAEAAVMFGLLWLAWREGAPLWFGSPSADLAVAQGSSDA